MADPVPTTHLVTGWLCRPCLDAGQQSTTTITTVPTATGTIVTVQCHACDTVAVYP
jgi:hypothetical protein